MNVFYLKEMNNFEEIINEKQKKFPKYIRKIIAWIKIKFGKIKLEDNVIILPANIKNKRLKKMLCKMIDLYCVKAVVLSKSLNNNENLKIILNSQNIDILDGRYLFRFLVFDVVNFVLEKKNKKIQDIELSLMINVLDDINIKTIFKFAKIVKRLNIVTNHMELFKKMEQKLYEEGIMIMVSNNKRKSLLKSDVVINMDFVEENLKEYKLNNNCVLVNLSSEIRVYSKGFNGININNYDITFENEIINQYSEEFDRKLLYESGIYSIYDFDKVLRTISEDNVTINKVIGNKGFSIIF